MELPVWFCLSGEPADLLAPAATGRGRGLEAGTGRICRRADPTKRIVLVIDHAGWHISDEVVVPEGVHPVFLPPYSPELQLTEQLWSLSDESLMNAHFCNLEALIDTQAEQCRHLHEQSEIIRAHTLFH